MTFLREWTNLIVTVIVLFTVIELIVTEGKLKANVLFVMGVIASIILSEPVIKLVKGDFKLDDIFESFSYDVLIYTDLFDTSLSYQTNALEKAFADKIMQELKVRYPELKVKNCLVIFAKDSDGKISDIERINVTVYEENYDVIDKVSEIAEVPKDKISMDIIKLEGE